MDADPPRVPLVILVFGGTSETAPLAEMLAESGFHVLVSTATDIPLNTGRHPHIRRRCGRLNADELKTLLHAEGIRAVVDAGHPYAAALHDTVRSVCSDMKLPLVRYQRPDSAVRDFPGVRWAVDHDEAAKLACRPGQRVLLTIGSRNIAPYAHHARNQEAVLFARVLPGAESLTACRNEGLTPAQIIAARGPFSIEDNRSELRKKCIQVVVTKESGAAGGFEEKLRAGFLENCRVVVVRRPVEISGNVCTRIETVVDKLEECLRD